MSEAGGMTPRSLAGARLRHEHTVRVVERQAGVLQELRSRASIVLSATGITASLFGATALDSESGSSLIWVALALVAIGLTLSVTVLVPVHDRGPMPESLQDVRRRRNGERPRRWKVTLTVDELDAATRHPTEEAILETIVEHLIPATRVNYRTIERRSLALNVAAAMLPVQVIAWSIAILAQ